MTTLNQSNIAIINYNELAYEVAKNLVLCGVKSVTLDSRGTEISQDSLDGLTRLNPKVTIIQSTVNTDNVSQYDALVLSNGSSNTITEFQNISVEYQTKFVYCYTDGSTGSVFSDFGQEFTVVDPDGKELYESTIESVVVNGNVFTITTTPATPHGFSVGSQFTMSGVDGFDFEEQLTVSNIVSSSIFEFEVKTEVNSTYQTGGIIHPIKETTIVTFQRLFDTVDDKFDPDTQFTSQMFSPTISIISGMAAQEVIKSCTHKLTPLNQWFHFDAQLDTSSDMSNQHWFVVGCGGIGCELLKNLAQLGLGKVTITDPDTVVLSNLNRQQFFLPEDVGRFKSKVVAEALQSINPNMEVNWETHYISPKTQSLYNQEFYSTVDGVVNCIDNRDTRVYMDQQCVFYGKPMIDCSMNGTHGSVHVTVPHQTEGYTSEDPPEHTVPMCTLKNFPSQIAHTIEWARNYFEGVFTNGPVNAVKFIQDPAFLDDRSTLGSGDRAQAIKDINSVLGTNHPTTYQDCIEYAYRDWHEKYHDTILQLLTSFPADHQTEEGVPFWSAGKRCPHPQSFDADSTMHVEYIVTFANLWADVHGITDKLNYDGIVHHLYTLSPPTFRPDTDAKISTTDDEEKKRAESQDEEELHVSAETVAHTQVQVTPITFDKNNDLHMDFVTSASNLRAHNYRIKTANLHETRKIAGKIIPSIATTVSVTAGLGSLEVYKIVTGDVSASNHHFDLAVSRLDTTDPTPVKKISYSGGEFTIWDSFEARGDQTLGQLLDELEDEKGLDISMVTYGSKMIYTFFMPPKKQKLRKEMTIRSILEEISDEALSDTVCLTLCTDEDDEVPQIKCYI